MLRVVGDSMIDDHITDGDLVLVERAVDRARRRDRRRHRRRRGHAQAHLPRAGRHHPPAAGQRARMEPIFVRPPETARDPRRRARRPAPLLTSPAYASMPCRVPRAPSRVRTTRGSPSSRTRTPACSAGRRGGTPRGPSGPARLRPHRALQVRDAALRPRRPPRRSRPRPAGRPAGRTSPAGSASPPAHRCRFPAYPARGRRRRSWAAATRSPPCMRRAASSTTSTGTARETPWLRPVRDRIAVIMPTTSPARVEERPARVPQVRRRVRLDEVLVALRGSRRRRGRPSPLTIPTDQERGRWNGTARREHPLPLAQARGSPIASGREPRRGTRQEGDVGDVVLSHDLRLERPVPLELTRTRLAPRQDVPARDDPARPGAKTKPAPTASSRELGRALALQHRGDVGHARIGRGDHVGEARPRAAASTGGRTGPPGKQASDAREERQEQGGSTSMVLPHVATVPRRGCLVAFGASDRPRTSYCSSLR